jgi:hypothetical protein
MKGCCLRSVTASSIWRKKLIKLCGVSVGRVAAGWPAECTDHQVRFPVQVKRGQEKASMHSDALQIRKTVCSPNLTTTAKTRCPFSCVPLPRI